jgi:hypothetical protein
VTFEPDTVNERVPLAYVPVQRPLWSEGPVGSVASPPQHASRTATNTAWPLLFICSPLTGQPMIHHGFFQRGRQPRLRAAGETVNV